MSRVECGVAAKRMYGCGLGRRRGVRFSYCGRVCIASHVPLGQLTVAVKDLYEWKGQIFVEDSAKNQNCKMELNVHVARRIMDFSLVAVKCIHLQTQLCPSAAFVTHLLSSLCVLL